ncbi:hypothetical protein R3I94_018948 [Phoxinus phoxinus]
MALFSSLLRQLFEGFAHFLRREGTPQRAQQCAAQESATEKLPEECEAVDFTANVRKCRRRRRKVVHSLEKLKEGGSELREAGEKKKKKRKRKERKIREPMPLLVKVKPLPTTVRCSFLKPIEGEPPTVTSVSGHLALPAAVFKPLPPVTKPPVHPQKPAPAPEDVLSLPCSPLQLDPPKLLAVPPCPDEVVSLRHSSSQVRHPKRRPPSPTLAHDEVPLRRPPSRKPEPFTSLFEPPPQLMLVDIEDEEDEYVEYTGKTIWTSDLLKSERPQTPEAEMKLRKTVAWLEKDSEVQEEAWASEGVEVQGPTPTHDEVVALRRPPSRKPQRFTSSLFEPPTQLMLVNIEDEENEYVEYTGKTIRTIDLLKSKRPQAPEAEMKPRKTFAWLEKDTEVQEEAWADEVEEVQEFKEEEGDPSEMGDSTAIQGHSDDDSHIDELTMKLVCESSTDGPENEIQNNVNVQKKYKRKVTFVLFTWVEEKVKKRKEKKIIKDREQREKELLLERYINDPKLKHLWINKHNRNYNSS